MNKKMLCAMAATACMACATAPAMADVSVSVRVAPPAPRVEAAPLARPGYVWAPGYWDWRQNRHVWVAGSWQRERRGYRYNSPQWEQNNGRWQLQRGGWARGDRRGDFGAPPPVVGPAPEVSSPHS